MSFLIVSCDPIKYKSKLREHQERIKYLGQVDQMTIESLELSQKCYILKASSETVVKAILLSIQKAKNCFWMTFQE